jgi:TRAP-type C4-dicarboxylate transport system permease small subunit
MAHFFMRIVAGVRLIAATIVVICFAYMTIAVLAQVFGRYVFNYSISWTEETARFAQAWVILIGAGITMRRGWHVAVDSLPEKLPLRIARALRIVLACGCIWFLSLVFYGSFALIELGWLFEVSPVLSIPMWIIYMALPLGTVYFGIEIVLSVIERWHQPFGVIKSSDSQIPNSEQSR